MTPVSHAVAGLLAATESSSSPRGGVVRTIISTGPGRLHLLLSAASLLDRGEDVRAITGWTPGPLALGAATAAARLGVAASLLPRLRARQACDGFPRERVRCCPFAETTGALAQRAFTAESPVASRVRRWAWEQFGRASRRHIREADVFHVRSGAGGGGAITTARRQGMAVIADHSIAHPAWMAAILTEEYARYGSPCPFAVADPFWQLVEEDCRAADAVLVNSEFVARTFRDHGFAEDRLRVVHLGVSPEWLGLKRDYGSGERLQLVFVGEFGIRKGAAYLLDALERIDPHRRRFSLTVIGRTPEMPLLARRHTISPSDRFLGQLDAAGVRSQVAAADVFVFPSLAEGCAKAAMEAMAAGTPVLATHETGLPAVSGEHAFLVPSRCVESLCEALTTLSLDADVRSRLGTCGARLAAEKFSWSGYGDRVRNVHSQAIATNGGQN